jgi:hypothetical protein
MTGYLHKGLTDALARAWEGKGRARAGPHWEVAVSHDDPWEDGPMGGYVVKVRHYGTCICVVARGTVVATATSASDRDGASTVARLLCPSGWAVSLRGGVPAIVDEGEGLHARMRGQRPHALDSLAETVDGLTVLPMHVDDASQTFCDAVSELMVWKGKYPHVADDGSLIYEGRWLSA